jgi:hypothetical protein
VAVVRCSDPESNSFFEAANTASSGAHHMSFFFVDLGSVEQKSIAEMGRGVAIC